MRTLPTPHVPVGHVPAGPQFSGGWAEVIVTHASHPSAPTNPSDSPALPLAAILSSASCFLPRASVVSSVKHAAYRSASEVGPEEMTQREGPAHEGPRAV